MKKIAAILCAATLMTACATQKKAAEANALSGEWTVIAIEGKAIEPKAAETIPFLGFDLEKSQVHGSAGCNRLTGGFKAVPAKGTIDFSPMGMTRMMCADMTVEDSFTQAIFKVKTYKIENGGSTLLLCDEAGKVMMTLKKK